MGNVVPLLRAERPEATEAVASVAPWTRAQLSGRLVELSAQGASASLTVAFGLVAQAQAEGEPVAWVSATPAMFFPPDAEEGGVDLGALVVIKVPSAPSAGRAADKLVRSGAFGLVVMDLGASAALAMGLQARLVKLAQKHDTAVLCITEKSPHMPSLSSLVSLRCAALRRKPDQRRPEFVCEVEVLKDKRRGPGWQHAEVCRGPSGLR